MKKFLIFIFAIFVLLIGMFAIMYNGYIKAYEEAHNHSSYSWTKETYPVEKYSNPMDEYNDNFELLFNLLVKKLFSPTLVEKEFKRAYETAKNLSADSPISMQAIKNKIKIYNYSEGANQYAVYKLNIDWKENAVKEAESYVNSGKISKEKLLEILVENKKFTQEEAEYAIEHAKIDLLD